MQLKRNREWRMACTVATIMVFLCGMTFVPRPQAALAVSGNINWEDATWYAQYSPYSHIERLGFFRHDLWLNGLLGLNLRPDTLEFSKPANCYAQIRRTLIAPASSYEVSVDIYGDYVRSWSWAPSLKLEWPSQGITAWIKKEAYSYARWGVTGYTSPEVSGKMYEDRWYTMSIRVERVADGTWIKLRIRDVSNNGAWVDLYSKKYAVWLTDNPLVYLGSTLTYDYSSQGSSELYYYDEFVIRPLAYASRSYDLLDQQLPLSITTKSNPLHFPVLGSTAHDVQLKIRVEYFSNVVYSDYLSIYKDDQWVTQKRLYSRLHTFTIALGDLLSGDHYLQFKLSIANRPYRITDLDLIYTDWAEIDMRVVKAQGFNHPNGVLSSWHTGTSSGGDQKGWDRVNFIATGIGFSHLRSWFKGRQFKNEDYQKASRGPYVGQTPALAWGQVRAKGNVLVGGMGPRYLNLGTPLSNGWYRERHWWEPVGKEYAGLRLAIEGIPDETFYQIRLWDSNWYDGTYYFVGACHLDVNADQPDHSGWQDYATNALYQYFRGWVGGDSYAGHKLIDCSKIQIHGQVNDGGDRGKFNNAGYAVVLTFIQV